MEGTAVATTTEIVEPIRTAVLRTLIGSLLYLVSQSIGFCGLIVYAVHQKIVLRQDSFEISLSEIPEKPAEKKQDFWQYMQDEVSPQIQAVPSKAKFSFCSMLLAKFLLHMMKLWENIAATSMIQRAK
jgi:hypothetical protein